MPPKMMETLLFSSLSLSLEGVERVVHGLLPKDSPRPALKPVGGGGAEAHASVTVLHAVVFVGGGGGRGGTGDTRGSKRRGCQ